MSRTTPVANIVLFLLLATAVACSSPKPAQSTSSTPVISGDVGTLTPPATQEPPSQFDPISWGLLYCPQREFPASIEPYSDPLEYTALIEAWSSYFADTTVIDSNTGIKSFELQTDGTGVWTDNTLRPVLHGRLFNWSITKADDERWSDINLVLSFDPNDYELTLPLRRRDNEIVDPSSVEGITVTERTCSTIDEFEPPEELPEFPEHIWRPSPGFETTPLPETMPTTARPGDLLWADGHMFADNGAGYWVKVDPDGNVITEFKAARTRAADYLFDGNYLWFSDRGEGELRKFDTDGNRLDTFRLISPNDLAFDGTNIWVETGPNGTTLVKLSTDGERLLDLELPGKTGSIFTTDGLMWVGLDEEWSIASYTMGGKQVSKTYLKGQPRGMGFDGTHLWVTVPDIERVYKLTLSGDIVDTITFPPRFSPNEVIYDGDQLWFINACCERANVMNIARSTVNAEMTGFYELRHAASDAEFDGHNVWFSHDDERAFTVLPKDAEGPFWKPIIGPYTEIELEIQTGNRVIGGTLTVPEGPGPHPVVIAPPNYLGDYSRDVVNLDVRRGHVRADDLARNGFATFRYDARNVFKAGRMEDARDSTIEEDAAELHAVIDAIKARPETDPEQIGIWGFGSTNLWTSIVLSERNDINYFVGSMLPLGRFLAESTGPQILHLRFTAESEEEIEEYAEFYNEAIDIARNGGDWLTYEQRILDLQNQKGRATPPLILTQPFQGLLFLESRKFAEWIDFDATTYMEQIDGMPYLLMYAGLDLTIPAEIYVSRAEEMIERSGNPDAQVAIFDKANFIFMPAIEGRLDGAELFLLDNIYYPSFIKPGVLETGTSWLIERTDFPE